VLIRVYKKKPVFVHVCCALQIKRRAEQVLRGKEQEALVKRDALKEMEKAHAAAE
jgi:hypothetical protein